MKQPRVFIEPEVVLLSAAEGGRSTPLSSGAYGGYYRPHMVLQSRDVREAAIELRDEQRHMTDEYLVVCFWSGPDAIPVGTPFTVTMLLMYPDHRAYDGVVRDAEFTLREGWKVVGHGRVNRRSNDEDA